MIPGTQSNERALDLEVLQHHRAQICLSESSNARTMLLYCISHRTLMAKAADSEGPDEDFNTIIKLVFQ